MSNFAKYAIMDLRLVLLRCLKVQPAFTCNDSILQHEAKHFGLDRKRDTIKSELRWLAEMGAVKLQEVGEDILVATLTRRGDEHVQGLTQIEGVNKPSPEA
jgi:hypothetical protein